MRKISHLSTRLTMTRSFFNRSRPGMVSAFGGNECSALPFIANMFFFSNEKKQNIFSVLIKHKKYEKTNMFPTSAAGVSGMTGAQKRTPARQDIMDAAKSREMWVSLVFRRAPDRPTFDPSRVPGKSGNLRRLLREMSLGARQPTHAGFFAAFVAFVEFVGVENNRPKALYNVVQLDEFVSNRAFQAMSCQWIVGPSALQSAPLSIVDRCFLCLNKVGTKRRQQNSCGSPSLYETSANEIKIGSCPFLMMKMN